MQRLSAAECERREKNTIPFHQNSLEKFRHFKLFFSHNELHFVYAFVCAGVWACARACLNFLRCLTRAINVFAYRKLFETRRIVVQQRYSFNFVRTELFSTEIWMRHFFCIPSTTARAGTPATKWTIIRVEFHQLKWQWLGKVFFISWLEKFSNYNKIDGNSISQSA